MKVIDLFSGLGGFSQAFLDRGHDVTRYDNDVRFKDVPKTIIRDVKTLLPGDLKGADIILASPDCRCFSVAAQSHYWPKGIPIEATRIQIDLVHFTVSLIEKARPRFWMLENPSGRMRQVLGKPARTTYWCAWGTRYKKPTDLWGILPPIDWKMPFSWDPNPSGGAGNAAIFKKDPYPRDAAKRALVPYAFSLAVCLAVEGKSHQEILE